MRWEPEVITAAEGAWPDAMVAVRNRTDERKRYVPERTCKWTLHEQWQNAEGNGYVYGFKTECGAQHTWWPDSLPSYCPSCGAKVVRDGD